MNLEEFLGLYNYWIVIFLMMTGFYIVIARHNLIKAVIGLNIFQTSVFLLYITMGKIRGGTAPIIPPQLVAERGHGHDESVAQHAPESGHAAIDAGHAAIDAGHAAIDIADVTAIPVPEIGAEIEPMIYSNPLPGVLMLTAIVVGIATTALALALIVRVRDEYGTIEEDRILEMDHQS